MLNDISTGLDKIDTASQDAAAGRASGQIDVQSGADDTGLPLLVLRSPFNVTAASAGGAEAYGHGSYR